MAKSDWYLPVVHIAEQIFTLAGMKNKVFVVPITVGNLTSKVNAFICPPATMTLTAKLKIAPV
jgi:hypothetical protein